MAAGSTLRSASWTTMASTCGRRESHGSTSPGLRVASTTAHTATGFQMVIIWAVQSASARIGASTATMVTVPATAASSRRCIAAPTVVTRLLSGARPARSPRVAHWTRSGSSRSEAARVCAVRRVPTPGPTRNSPSPAPSGSAGAFGRFRASARVRAAYVPRSATSSANEAPSRLRGTPSSTSRSAISPVAVVAGAMSSETSSGVSGRASNRRSSISGPVICGATGSRVTVAHTSSVTGAGTASTGASGADGAAVGAAVDAADRREGAGGTGGRPRPREPGSGGSSDSGGMIDVESKDIVGAGSLAVRASRGAGSSTRTSSESASAGSSTTASAATTSASSAVTSAGTSSSASTVNSTAGTTSSATGASTSTRSSNSDGSTVAGAGALTSAQMGVYVALAGTTGAAGSPHSVADIVGGPHIDVAGDSTHAGAGVTGVNGSAGRTSGVAARVSNTGTSNIVAPSSGASWTGRSCVSNGVASKTGSKSGTSKTGAS